MRAEILLGRVAPHPWLSAPWRCWHELTADRAYVTEGVGGGFGPGRIFSRPQPIGWRVIVAWCRLNRVPDDDLDDHLALIRAMDRAYLDYANRKIDQAVKAALK